MKSVVITGGPGAGKTSIIELLSKHGYCTFEESSRHLIEQQSQLSDGVLPWTNLEQFAQLCLDMMLQQKKSSQAKLDICFFDRAIPDICAYLQLGNLEVETSFIEASSGYYNKVFFCAPNADIYSQDEVRPHPFSEALDIHQLLLDCYRNFGYQPIEVPWGTVEERVDFILNHIN
ncbi:AAA family ATPase [Vibrio sp. TH_r3]|uniref:AAA family ATPase n=1 Tax=Vibrio sp. TH_r3 TaxID=3082084 RepID=UPI00295465A5|nr:AAA family ATPase [Vibrio sp. TH_r3]MDV7104137.1 AAA family ATPase [Vibrio sp. TH_r3]